MLASELESIRVARVWDPLGNSNRTWHRGLGLEEDLEVWLTRNSFRPGEPDLLTDTWI